MEKSQHPWALICRVAVAAALCVASAAALSANAPQQAQRAMVVSQNALASQIGARMMREGGSAMDAVVATAFALAVVHPTAGNIGGGGFLVYRPAEGEAIAYDFREVAPMGSHARMWVVDDEYSFRKHHMSHAAVAVPGTVAGLHLAWREHGRLPWKRLVAPAIELARDGFVVSQGLAASLARSIERFERHPASRAQFTRDGESLPAGEVLKQRDLAASLKRIAREGPEGFYRGRTAELIVAEMAAHGGLITMEDLAGYAAVKRRPLRGVYRGYEILSMPPPSSGGVALVQMLNILEGYDLSAAGAGSAAALHLMAEAMRRAYADRARFLGDPDFNAEMPVERLTSKAYAADLRSTISPDRAAVSSPSTFEWAVESEETTHVSVVDGERNAAAMTYTLEWPYGSAIVVPGAGFLLNNEMGDFNARPGLTTDTGLIGTEANLAEPGKRMLSSMTPTVVAHDGELFMVTGSPGGRTIINTVMQTIINVIDHGMNAQAAVDAPRIHHQWLPDTLSYERQGPSPDTLRLLEARGHKLKERERQGSAQIIVVAPDSGYLQAGVDRRVVDAGASGY